MRCVDSRQHDYARLSTSVNRRAGWSGEYHLRGAQSLHVHPHPVPPCDPLGGHDAAGEHDVAAAQSDAVGGELVGQPGQRGEGVTQHVAAHAAPAFLAVDGHGSRQRREVEPAPADSAGPSTMPAWKKSSAMRVGVSSERQST